MGVRFLTKADLLPTETEYGKKNPLPFAPPDMLLLDDAWINGEPIAWIKIKHGFGSTLSSQQQKESRLVRRYNDEYGQGAIVYSLGFAGRPRVRGALRLDARAVLPEP